MQLTISFFRGRAEAPGIRGETHFGNALSNLRQAITGTCRAGLSMKAPV